jgi:YidC/Oxa1 family membrane protein insertase
MSTFLGVPVDAAYHVVSLFVRILAPVLGGLAAAAAIVAFTMAVRLLLLPLSYRAMRGLEAQARLAPMIAALRKKHAKQPDRLQREMAALYRAEGTSMFAGFGPLVLQWPFFSVMYLLFRSSTVGGRVNTLLSHDLLGAPLSSHWLGGAGPLSAQGAVFAGLFVLLALLGWLSYRVARRQKAAAPAIPAVPVARPTRATSATRTTAATRKTAATRATPATPATPTALTSPTGLLARLTPYITVVIAAFLPLAAGLYLVTTTAWTLAERILLRQRLAGSDPAKRAPA